MSASRLLVRVVLAVGMAALLVAAQPRAQPTTTEATDAGPRRADFKAEVVVDVEARRDFTQQMVDSIFSFNELGFQEFETQKYVTGILEEHGFEVETGVAGIPTSWVASWGSGEPVIALGTDIDGIPQASQKPGVAYRDPLIAGAPGHGEGHNSGLRPSRRTACRTSTIQSLICFPDDLLEIARAVIIRTSGSTSAHPFSVAMTTTE